MKKKIPALPRRHELSLLFWMRRRLRLPLGYVKSSRQVVVDRARSEDGDSRKGEGDDEEGDQGGAALDDDYSGEFENNGVCP